MTLPKMLCMWIALLAACADGSGPQAPAPDGSETVSGSISGQVRSSTNDEPLVDARVQLQPGATAAVSDPEGRYTFDNLPVEERGTAYILTVSADGFRTLIRTIVLTTEEPAADLDIELIELEDDELPQAQSFQIRGYWDAEEWPPVDHLVAIVEIQVLGPEPVSSVVLVDTLDAAFGYRIAPEDISININDSFLSPAGLAIAPDGLSLRIELGDLQPTEGFVRVFSLTIPPPQGNGVWCNHVHASGIEGSEPAGDVHIFCLTTPLGD